MSRIADSVCPFLYWSQCTKGHAASGPEAAAPAVSSPKGPAISANMGIGGGG